MLIGMSGSSRRTNCVALLAWLCAGLAHAATFSGNARVEAADTNGALSWSPAANALTVSCWFKLVVPSDKTLAENMTVVVNRRTGTEASPYAYLIRYNVFNGRIEFLSRGASALFTGTLIQGPYLDRWYHVAVVRSGDLAKGYVDGREVFSQACVIGSSANTDGLSVGGWGTVGSGSYLLGEVQEVAVYQAALGPEFITERLFRDQPTDVTTLRGYYKLAYSTVAADQLRNFAVPPPAGTTPAVLAGSGHVTFEETNQAGEQSAFDSRRNGGTEAISPLSGGFSWSHVLFARPTPGIAFDLRMVYGSANAAGGNFIGSFDTPTLGAGWRHSFEARVLPSQYFSPVAATDVLGLMSWDGSIETWEYDAASQTYKTRHKEYRGELSLPDNSVCQWTTPERLIYRFRHPNTGAALMRGRLIDIADPYGNAVRLAWNESLGIVTQVTDTVGGRYLFRYSAANQVTNVAFRGWTVHFAYDAQSRLTSKWLTAPAAYSNLNTRWNFAYHPASGLLNRITDPRGNGSVNVEYDAYGRVTRTTDALNRATATQYAIPAKRQITRTDPGGFKWIETYDRKGRVTENRDPLGYLAKRTYDEAGNVRTATEPLGWTTTYDYDARANVLTNVNALGERRVWTYHVYYNKPLTETDPLGWLTRYYYSAAGSLTNHCDGLGSLVRYAYDSRGLVTTATDANGHATRFDYDANGFQAAITDPATNTTRFAKNEWGWVLAQTNALGQVTTFLYDINGNVVQRTDPLDRVYTSVFDPSGNLTAQSDAKGQYTRFAFDAANQRTQMLDRVGARWRTVYTSRGEVDRVIDPLGNAVLNAYDAANRLSKVTDPLNGSVTNIYDANGNLTAMIDKTGQRWTKTYDRLNRVTAETDPLGNTRRITFDAAGRIDTLTSPNGHPSVHRYDGRGRLTRWVDAESYVWLYDYDGVGNITNITDALGGHYVMAYGPRNERVVERNQDGFEWRYAYDPLLRPERQNDPNGTARSIFYDDGGRIDYVGFSTGRTDDYQYDENNNLTLLSRSRPGQPPTPTSLAYDAMDRPAQVTDAFGKVVKYAYDAMGRVDRTTYPGNRDLRFRYDALSRLTNQTDWAGRALAYTYDKAGRLVWRRYPNCVEQTNALDVAGRAVQLSYSVPSGLSGYWSFDDGTATDQSGNGHHLTLSGGISLVTGKVGRAVQTDGSTGHALSPGRIPALETADHTVTAWVKSTRGTSQGIAGYLGQNGTAGFGLQVSGNRFGFLEARPTGWDYALTAAACGSDGLWHHLAGVRQGGVARIYLDGVLQTSTTAVVPTFVGDSRFCVGYDRYWHFEGAIDEVYAYNRALSAQEVNLLRESTEQPALTNAAISVQILYAYDRNGNKTSATEQGTLEWPIPSPIDETARHTASGRLIDRVDAAATNRNWVYHYDVSGNMTNAVGAGQSITLTYDEDNRVLSVLWDGGLTSKRIENRYDALGRRVSRKVDGIETRYILDLQGNMERILCDTTTAGQITSTYVYGPDLAYKVDAANALTCYHADAQANIIALSDAAGVAVGQYAYTPYGRSLGSSAQPGVAGNPYRFVGSQGVMEELPGLYFMRARYYSADAGVFLSTDPVKHVGPGWKPVTYGYADGNPLSNADPEGEMPQIIAAALIGGAIGGGADLLGQVLSGRSLDEVDWGSVGASTVKGAATGAMISVGVHPALASGLAEFAWDMGANAGQGKVDIASSLTKGALAGGTSLLAGGVFSAGPAALSPTHGSYAKLLQGGQGWNTVSGLKGGQTVFSAAFAHAGPELVKKTIVSTAKTLLADRAPSAATYAQSVCDFSALTPSSCTIQSGTSTFTAGSGSGSSGGGGASGSSFSKAAATVKSAVTTAANNVSSAVKSAGQTVKQAVSSAVKSVSAFVSKVFSRGKK